MEVSKDFINFPDLIELNNYGNNYGKYETALLNTYEADLWKGGLTFNGLKVLPRVHKKFQYKDKFLDWTFAHFTTTGKNEDDRVLDLRRCERIGWIKPIIENAHLDCVKVWENQRYDKKGKPVTSVVLWCEMAKAKVVLTKNKSKTKENYLITTFYLINNNEKIKSHTREYITYVEKHGKFNVIPCIKQ